MGVTTVIKDYGTDILNAIRENDVQRVKNILEKQLRTDRKIQKLCVSDIKHKPTKKFACPLILAARQEDPRIMKYMMDKGTDPNFIHHTIFSSKRKEIVTALHISVDLGHYDTVQVLCDANADCNIGDHNQETPLHIAVKKADRVMTRLLLSKGADPSIPDRRGNAALHIATLYGHLQLVRSLLKYNADVYQRGQWGTISPHIAAKEGHIHLIQLFCSRDVGNINIKIPCYTDKREKAPIHLAAENGHVETVLALLDQFDGEVNLKDSDLNTPLHCVVLNQYNSHRMRDKDYFNETAKVLLKFGVAINEKNSFGDTALHLAAMNQFQRIVELLLECGANPFVENQEHLKPIDVVPDFDPVTKQVIKNGMLNPKPLSASRSILNSVSTLNSLRSAQSHSSIVKKPLSNGSRSSGSGTPDNMLDHSLEKSRSIHSFVSADTMSVASSVFDEKTYSTNPTIKDEHPHRHQQKQTTQRGWGKGNRDMEEKQNVINSDQHVYSKVNKKSKRSAPQQLDTRQMHTMSKQHQDDDYDEDYNEDDDTSQAIGIQMRDMNMTAEVKQILQKQRRDMQRYELDSVTDQMSVQGSEATYMSMEKSRFGDKPRPSPRMPRQSTKTSITSDRLQYIEEDSQSSIFDDNESVQSGKPKPRKPRRTDRKMSDTSQISQAEQISLSNIPPDVQGMIAQQMQGDFPGGIRLNAVPGKPGMIEVQYGGYGGAPITIQFDTSSSQYTVQQGNDASDDQQQVPKQQPEVPPPPYQTMPKQQQQDGDYDDQYSESFSTSTPHGPVDVYQGGFGQGSYLHELNDSTEMESSQFSVMSTDTQQEDVRNAIKQTVMEITDTGQQSDNTPQAPRFKPNKKPRQRTGTPTQQSQTNQDEQNQQFVQYQQQLQEEYQQRQRELIEQQLQQEKQQKELEEQKRLLEEQQQQLEQQKQQQLEKQKQQQLEQQRQQQLEQQKQQQLEHQKQQQLEQQMQQQLEQQKQKLIQQEEAKRRLQEKLNESSAPPRPMQYARADESYGQEEEEAEGEASPDTTPNTSPKYKNFSQAMAFAKKLEEEYYSSSPGTSPITRRKAAQNDELGIPKKPNGTSKLVATPEAKKWKVQPGGNAAAVVESSDSNSSILRKVQGRRAQGFSHMARKGRVSPQSAYMDSAQLAQSGSSDQNASEGDQSSEQSSTSSSEEEEEGDEEQPTPQAKQSHDLYYSITTSEEGKESASADNAQEIPTIQIQPASKQPQGRVGAVQAKSMQKASPVQYSQVSSEDPSSETVQLQVIKLESTEIKVESEVTQTGKSQSPSDNLFEPVTESNMSLTKSSPDNNQDATSLQSPSIDDQRSTGSKTPDSILSDGSARGLKMRVTGEVPKAYTKMQKEPARKAFIKHYPPVRIESCSESEDNEWSYKEEYVSAPGNLASKSPQPTELGNKDLSDMKPIVASKPVKLIGKGPAHYKSFGKIEPKIDALLEALEEQSVLSDLDESYGSALMEHSFHEGDPVLSSSPDDKNNEVLPTSSTIQEDNIPVQSPSESHETVTETQDLPLISETNIDDAPASSEENGISMDDDIVFDDGIKTKAKKKPRPKLDPKKVEAAEKAAKAAEHKRRSPGPLKSPTPLTQFTILEEAHEDEECEESSKPTSAEKVKKSETEKTSDTEITDESKVEKKQKKSKKPRPKKKVTKKEEGVLGESGETNDTTTATITGTTSPHETIAEIMNIKENHSENELPVTDKNLDITNKEDSTETENNKGKKSIKREKPARPLRVTRPEAVEIHLSEKGEGTSSSEDENQRSSVIEVVRMNETEDILKIEKLLPSPLEKEAPLNLSTELNDLDNEVALISAAAEEKRKKKKIKKRIKQDSTAPIAPSTESVEVVTMEGIQQHKEVIHAPVLDQESLQQMPTNLSSRKWGKHQGLDSKHQILETQLTNNGQVPPNKVEEEGQKRMPESEEQTNIPTKPKKEKRKKKDKKSKDDGSEKVAKRSRKKDISVDASCSSQPMSSMTQPMPSDKALRLPKASDPTSPTRSEPSDNSSLGSPTTPEGILGTVFGAPSGSKLERSDTLKENPNSADKRKAGFWAGRKGKQNIRDQHSEAVSNVHTAKNEITDIQSPELIIAGAPEYHESVNMETQQDDQPTPQVGEAVQVILQETPKSKWGSQRPVEKHPTNYHPISTDKYISESNTHIQSTNNFDDEEKENSKEQQLKEQLHITSHIQEQDAETKPPVETNIDDAFDREHMTHQGQFQSQNFSHQQYPNQGHLQVQSKQNTTLETNLDEILETNLDDIEPTVHFQNKNIKTNENIPQYEFSSQPTNDNASSHLGQHKATGSMSGYSQQPASQYRKSSSSTFESTASREISSPRKPKDSDIMAQLWAQQHPVSPQVIPTEEESKPKRKKKKKKRSSTEVPTAPAQPQTQASFQDLAFASIASNLQQKQVHQRDSGNRRPSEGPPAPPGVYGMEQPKPNRQGISSDLQHHNQQLSPHIRQNSQQPHYEGDQSVPDELNAMWQENNEQEAQMTQMVSQLWKDHKDHEAEMQRVLASMSDPEMMAGDGDESFGYYGDISTDQMSSFPTNTLPNSASEKPKMTAAPYHTLPKAAKPAFEKTKKVAPQQQKTDFIPPSSQGQATQGKPELAPKPVSKWGSGSKRNTQQQQELDRKMALEGRTIDEGSPRKAPHQIGNVNVAQSLQDQHLLQQQQQIQQQQWGQKKEDPTEPSIIKPQPIYASPKKKPRQPPQQAMNEAVTDKWSGQPASTNQGDDSKTEVVIMEPQHSDSVQSRREPPLNDDEQTGRFQRTRSVRGKKKAKRPPKREGHGTTSDTEMMGTQAHQSIRFEQDIQSEAELFNMEEQEPGKTFEDIAFDKVMGSLKDQPKLKPRKPIWDTDQTINYTRGVYRPRPGPTKWENRSATNAGSGRYDDSAIISKTWSEKHGITSNTESEAEGDIEDQHWKENKDSFLEITNKKQVHIVENKENQPSAFKPISPSSKKVTIVEKPKKGRRKKKRTKDAPRIMEPGPIDFSQYGPTAQLWMEQVDEKTVKKSKTMYMAVMPENQNPPEALTKSLPKYEMASDDVFLPPQWVVARGRSLRKKKKESAASQSSMLNRSYASESEGEMGPDRPISPGRQMLLFFRIGSNWKDLAWILFEGLLNDSETIRMIKDIQLKHPGQLREQVNDMMNRWWKKRSSDATIEELQRALDIINLGYVRDDYFDHRGSVTAYTDTEDDLDISEISDNDPDVSRMIGEYDLNNSFELEANSENHPYSISSEGIHRKSSERGLNTSRTSRLDTSRDSIGRRSMDRYNISHEALDETFDSSNKFLIIQPQLKQAEYRHESTV